MTGSIRRSPFSGGLCIWLERAFYLAFAVLLCAVLWTGFWVFRSDARTYAVLPWAGLFLLGAVLFDRFAARVCKGAWLKKRFLLIAGSVAAVFFFTNLAFFCAFRYSPVWDADAVYQGAQNWAAGSLTAVSTPTFNASTYFCYFPNNLGAAAVLSWAYRLCGAGDPYFIACLFTALLLICAILATAFTARELGGERMGLNALLLIVLTFPLFCCSAAFYTDFLSFAFPVSTLFFLARARRCQTVRTRVALYALAAAVCAVGALIKPTTWILPIAAVLWALLERDWKRAALCAALFSAFAGTAFWLLDCAVYPSQLDREQAKALNTPAQHWIMMGLAGDGLYNGSDYEFTRSFADPEERKAALNAEIGRRLREYGPVGFLKHAFRKLGYMLNDGTLMLSDYYDDSPSGPSWLTEILLPGGGGYDAWKAICGGTRLCMLLLVLIAVMRRVASARSGPSGTMYLAVFGLLLFLSLWETSKRYTINYLPIWILCAAQGSAPFSGKPDTLL